MDGPGALDGVDDIPWADLGHAYAREHLRHLAERDQRIIRWHISSDEILRAEIRHLLQDLR